MSTSLTKRKQKSLSFRAKQKAKKSGTFQRDQEDVPEYDLAEEGVSEDKVNVDEGVTTTKKRKMDYDACEEPQYPIQVGAKVKPKVNMAWEADATKMDGVDTKKSKKEIKQRFLLFVGQ